MPPAPAPRPALGVTALGRLARAEDVAGVVPIPAGLSRCDGALPVGRGM
ncbi:hypothetical protein GCM10022214_29260 [Actinomadura miaoliensis]|uniref:Uncharacterized protein n=1 Tax=Actinomadura miaoliensis TaxID=430685 RepID=A0ABP7VPP7_9ACTN